MLAKETKSKMNHTELVNHCARNLTNNKAWLEFLSRYQGRIYNTVIQECQKCELHKRCFQFEETVADLVQDVYLKLLQNDCKALKIFRGESENAIYSYLAIISKNVVKNYVIRMQAKKRPRIDKSQDDAITAIGENGAAYYHAKHKPAIFNTDQEFKLKILKEEIDYCLQKTLTGRDKERNKTICQLYLYDGYTPKEIASHFDFGLSTRRIANIISDSRQKLIRASSLVEDYGNITC